MIRAGVVPFLYARAAVVVVGHDGAELARDVREVGRLVPLPAARVKDSARMGVDAAGEKRPKIHDSERAIGVAEETDRTLALLVEHGASEVTIALPSARASGTFAARWRELAAALESACREAGILPTTALHRQSPHRPARLPGDAPNPEGDVLADASALLSAGAPETSPASPANDTAGPMAATSPPPTSSTSSAPVEETAPPAKRGRRVLAFDPGSAWIGVAAVDFPGEAPVLLYSRTIPIGHDTVRKVRVRGKGTVDRAQHVVSVDDLAALVRRLRTMLGAWAPDLVLVESVDRVHFSARTGADGERSVSAWRASSVATEVAATERVAGAILTAALLAGLDVETRTAEAWRERLTGKRRKVDVGAKLAAMGIAPGDDHARDAVGLALVHAAPVKAPRIRTPGGANGHANRTEARAQARAAKGCTGARCKRFHASDCALYTGKAKGAQQPAR